MYVLYFGIIVSTQQLFGFDNYRGEFNCLCGDVSQCQVCLLEIKHLLFRGKYLNIIRVTFHPED